MGTWTLYTSGADITLLQTILNGVAMICTQSTFIWGFALLASFWRLISTATAGAVAAAGGGSGSVLATGWMGAITPLILAMLLNNPAAQCTVQVESTLNGNLTQVANVPFVIAVIPAAASQLGVSANQMVTTAFSAVNPSYDYISATNNGFLDPMRRLLGARTAIQRLGGIDSEIRTVLSDCLTLESGVNYAEINRLVVNAGNSGATSAQTIDINGNSSTAMGALLFQAAQNLNGTVPDLVSPSQPQTILSCPDAVTQLQSDIDAALTSAEFSRVIQGAVNGMDQPNPSAAYDIGQLSTEYNGLRDWTSVPNALSQGQTQANSEAINWLFAEEVGSSLNCLQAGGPDLANCQAAMVQSNEIERNNLQAAANEVPMLKYAGSFGSYLLALIIGLGPIIVMFMMFAGVNLGTSIMTVVHIMVWPILVMNVGAELVNAMISMQFSNFLATVSQGGGYLSQAVMLSTYKELSLQVGVGSHIMASLPVLMSMIFALGETAALVSVAKEAAPQGKEVGDLQAPSPASAAALVNNSSPTKATQGRGFASVQAEGAFEGLSFSQTFGSTGRELTRAIGEQHTDTDTISAAQTNARQWTKAFQTGVYDGLGVTFSEGESVRHATEASKRTSNSQTDAIAAGSQRENANRSGADVKVGGSVKGVLGVPVPSVDVSANASTGTSATDRKSLGETATKTSAEEQTRAVNEALASEVGQRIERSHRTDSNQTFARSRSQADNFQKLQSSADSETKSAQEVARLGGSLIGAYNKIGSPEIAQQLATNGEYQRFQLSAGRSRDADPSTRKYRAAAEAQMSSGEIASMEGNPQAREAVVRTRAAVLQAGDAAPMPQAERDRALAFLAEGAQAMTHLAVPAVTQSDVQRRDLHLSGPVDDTGVEVPASAAPPGHTHSRARHHANATTRPGPAQSVQAEVPSPGLAAQPAPTESHAVGDTVAARIHDAEKAGLGETGEGTVARAAKNVVDNVVDLGRTAGSGSRVTFATRKPGDAAEHAGGASGSY